MKKLQAVGGWRALVCGVVLAALGFSFALATSGDAASRGTELGSRAVGTGATRLPTEFYTASDLGVVVVGSQFARQILVRFGFKPHLFKFGAFKPQSGGITISNSGTLQGVKDSTLAETFTVTVVDDIGVEDQPVTTKAFTIRGVDYQQAPDLLLQFADVAVPGTTFNLPNALANESYSFWLGLNGGTPPYRVKFVSDKDFEAFPPGLALSRSGLIYGKPMAPGVFAFNLSLKDADHTEVVQKFALTVGVGTITSEFVATKGTFKLNFGKEGGKDSLALALVLNKTELASSGVRTAADLVDVPFILEFGGAILPPLGVQVDQSGTATGNTFPSIFDKNGGIRFPNIRKNVMSVKGIDTQYEISLDPVTGLLKAKFTNVDLITELGAQFNTFKDPIIPVSVKIGQSAKSVIDNVGKVATEITGTTQNVAVSDTGIDYDKTDVIKFVYTRRGSIGKGTARANDKKPPGGFFLITKAEGVEAVKGATNNRFDQIFVRMKGRLRQPDGAPVQPKSTDTIDMLLGEAPLVQFSASTFTGSGDTLVFTNANPAIPLKSLTIDNVKGTFSIETFAVSPRTVFGQDVLEAGKPFSASLTITIRTSGAKDPTFDGQATVTLFRKGNKIINK
jgi:hypothetical protein